MLLLFIALSALGAVLAQASEPAPLALALYYEALCPDCRRFVVNQLNVTYSRVPEILNVTFVPWAKANVSADGTIHCQHGPEECWGNRLLACVADAASSDAVRMRAVSCLMDKQKTLPEDGPACVAAAGQIWAEQVACADSEAARQEALENGRLTAALDPPLTWTPTVTIDGSQGTAEEQKQLVDDLLASVCSLWQARSGEMPAGCP